MKITHKTIGIWGFGIVGKSALNYFLSRCLHVEVLDTKYPSPSEQEYLALHNIPFFLQENELTLFLERNDYILPSPGIDLQPYATYQHKWLSELDLFAQEYKKPIIAITGTVGKTSITHLLGQLLKNAGLNVSIGGNIGTGMLDLLNEKTDATLLEVSSFQLELCKSFAPTLAIWTNFYPNHLDRHTTITNYFNAKCRLITQQKSPQMSLLPLALSEQLPPTVLHSDVSYFSSNAPTDNDIQRCALGKIYHINNSTIDVIEHGNTRTLINITELPSLSYTQNWIIICAVLDLLAIPLSVITQSAATLTMPEHRLEKITTINGTDFYNDSKSTTPQSTLAALQQLQGKPLHLFLGGISKGIDRTAMIAQLKNKVHYVYCFGKEADQLSALCTAHTIDNSSYATLDEAVSACIKNIHPGDVVLFSPAGASFDLFENYGKRGEYFKKIVREHCIKDVV